ncbi:MAG: hypothetical protein V3U35_07070 [Candidatus Neomarinimicrobiota bacterium]
MSRLRLAPLVPILLGGSLSTLQGQNVSAKAQLWLGVTNASDPAPGSSAYGETLGFIPTLSLAGESGRLAGLDAELAIQGTATLDGFFGAGAGGVQRSLKPYRAWGRYVADNFDLRLGLQKLSFGPGRFLRTLIWFDTLDLRDPTGQTGGVTALRLRYYPGSQLALWGWLLAADRPDIPSPGGRAEYTFGLGELALTYDYRRASDHEYASRPFLSPLVDEERIAADVRIDWHIGFWAEAASIRSPALDGESQLAMLGADYTLGWGQGLYVMAEHLWTRVQLPALGPEQVRQVSVALASYPLGMTDQLLAIGGYDWHAEQTFAFMQWLRSYDYLSLYLMFFAYPDGAGDTGSSSAVAVSGNGAQFMIILNY